MEEDESFDKFYAKLKDIVNSALILGKPFLNPRLWERYSDLYPRDFHAKITAIEESKDIDKIPLTKLVGNLQTYELGLTRIEKSSKSKSMVLKAKSSDIDESSNDEDSKMKSYITSQFKSALLISRPSEKARHLLLPWATPSLRMTSIIRIMES